ncbi:bifunctional folylpolyglutamate synthase/dihydrofolate synthase [Anaerocolumna xylanovorans]|uniref:tetrahydrofolate synthase n=1 Tax=Anaerocolumna xylanovorans DSM 12503 TaxID=1121345 RepID=A0A1M7YJ26_9FIRM|nr:folylpolyglutamate synthase/dihydrofolate synthase family protein [Anaerocolumna xylanovorans]SHO52610.1 dihydrofolate synthase / folylpolyglutamate synthase [Anaerocolumna xylanovorans DSM 12503]
MEYSKAISFLEEVKKTGSKPGLTAISQLLKELDSPQEKVAFVHVAGTNAKGSVSAYIASILACAGYVTGRFSSPAVFQYEEMIQIISKQPAGKRNEDTVSKTDASAEIDITSIEREEFASCIEVIKGACERMTAKGKDCPTIFEVETAMAFLYFYRKKCDIAVIEVGMGGRLDATNIIDSPKCAVLTAISMDHTEYLGHTLKEIAWHKAGIIKKGIPVVSYKQEEEAEKVIEETAKEMEASLITADFSKVTIKNMDMGETLFDYGDWKNLKIKLLGKNQIYNAVTAIHAAGALNKNGISLKTEDIYEGLKNAVWEGRFQCICKSPLIMIDGAHNEGAARALADNIRLYLKDKTLYYIMGIFKDKDYEAVLRLTAGYASEIYCITPPNIRALPSKELADAAAKQGKKAVDAITVRNALSMIKEKTKEDKNYAVLAFGSLSILKEVKEEVYRLYLQPQT